MQTCDAPDRSFKTFIKLRSKCVVTVTTGKRGSGARDGCTPACTGKQAAGP